MEKANETKFRPVLVLCELTPKRRRVQRSNPNPIVSNRNPTQDRGAIAQQAVA